RLTIAALHVVQPFARSYGYLRGRLSPPTTGARRHTPGEQTEIFTAPRRRSQPALLLGRSGERCFWSETSATGDALLARVVERLRIARFGRGIQVDDGWRPDRDISVAVGDWGWAHVRALVEDHGTGRCLFRTRVHVRLRAGIVMLFALAISACIFAISDRFDLLAAAIAMCTVMLIVRVAKDVFRDARQIVDVVESVAVDYGMQSIP